LSCGKAPIQVDIARLLGGGLVPKRVGCPGIADKAARRGESAILPSGAREQRLHIADLQQLLVPGDVARVDGGGGTTRVTKLELQARQRIRTLLPNKWDLSPERYGGSRAGSNSGLKHQRGFRQLPKADIRQMRGGFDGSVATGRGITFPQGIMPGSEARRDIYRAWINDEPLRFHDAAAGKSTKPKFVSASSSRRLQRR